MSGEEAPRDEVGCKQRGRLAPQLQPLITDYWLYFTRRGVLNSDGRRLVARVAREASRGGCRVIAERLWRLLREPTLEELLRIAGLLGLDVSGLEESLWGPSSWRVRRPWGSR